MNNLQSSSKNIPPAAIPAENVEDEEALPRASNITAATIVVPSTSASDIPATALAESSSTPQTTDTIFDSSKDASGPICIITLLLTSGARHPYKLDEKYLNKRNVNIPGLAENGRKDPFSISVYTLKELILREWRDEWEGRPSSPSSIRLIHFGRLLDDKVALKGLFFASLSVLRGFFWKNIADFSIIECRFNTDSPNVVHMTVRPQEVVDEEDASKGKAMGRDGAGSERTAGCRCLIM